MSNLFQTLQIEAFRKGVQPRTAESREWFRKRAQRLRRVNRTQLMKEEPIDRVNRIMPGDMAMFFYDPKTKDTLPYYDTFPLVIVVGKAEGGFYGLNLHYLPPVLRAKFLDSLLEITNNKVYDESTKFQVSYALLQRAAKFKYFKPCFKHYLTEHVQSRFARIEAPEWEIATFLPTAQFQKNSTAAVYKNSRGMINGR
jgi:hypothetical protein